MDVLIIGSGPAGLMAATRVLQQAGGNLDVVIADRHSGIGRKLLIAGSTRLNITFDTKDAESFLAYYQDSHDELRGILNDFSPERWIGFLEQLGLETFLGTSGRYFLKDPTAARMVKLWAESVRGLRGRFHLNKELQSLERSPEGWRVGWSDGSADISKVVLLSPGGPSYSQSNSNWPTLLGLTSDEWAPWRASNVGFRIRAPKEFFAEAEGKPWKNFKLSTSRGSKLGEVIVTGYGLEGPPVYYVGVTGEAQVDCFPQWEHGQLADRLAKVKEKMSPIRRISKTTRLDKAALAYLYHQGLKHFQADSQDTLALATFLKGVPVALLDPRPIDEAISAAGGLRWEYLTVDLEFKSKPGLFAAGEFINWDAPTGGFLLQASVATGWRAAGGILKVLGLKS